MLFKHPFLNLNMGLVKENFVIAKKDDKKGTGVLDCPLEKKLIRRKQRDNPDGFSKSVGDISCYIMLLAKPIPLKDAQACPKALPLGELPR